jgi:hypothetical protein
MPEATYQSLLREEYGWNDLPERAQRLRRHAERVRQSQAQLNALRTALAQPDERIGALDRLKQALKHDPDSDALLYLCGEQARCWLEQEGAFAVEWVETILQLGVDWGQGPHLGYLRQLQAITRIIRTTRDHLSAERFVDAAGHALLLHDYADEQHSGWQAMRLLLQQGLRHTLQAQAWSEVEILWRSLEQLGNTPDQIDQEFTDVFGTALCAAIDTRREPAIKWLWDYATARYSDPSAVFWEQPVQHMQQQIQSLLDTARICDVDGDAIIAARKTAGQQFATILRWLSLTGSLNLHQWSQSFKKQMQDMNCAFEDAAAGWEAYQQYRQEQAWEQVVAQLAAIRQIPLDWHDAEVSFQQLHDDAIDQWIKQLQDQTKQIFPRADEAADSDTLIAIYNEGEAQINLLRELAGRERRRIDETQLRQRLQTIQTERKAACTHRETVEKIRQAYDQAYTTTDPVMQLLLLLEAHKLCGTVAQSKWHRLGIQDLLATIEQQLTVRVEHACDSLLHYYLLQSAVEGTPADYLLNRARGMLSRISIDQTVRSAIQQRLEQAPREFRLEILQKRRDHHA